MTARVAFALGMGLGALLAHLPRTVYLLAHHRPAL